MRLAQSSLVAVLVLASACADVATTPQMQRVNSSSSIQGGQLTGADYGNVGALMYDFGHNGITGGDEVCTGSLISPTVFLTAAHCVVGFPAGSQFIVTFEPDLYAATTFVAATGYAYDPQYGHDMAHLHDLAVVFLPAGSTTGITPLTLPTAGALDAMSARGKLSKAMFVNVGYGVSANRTRRPFATYDGTRKASLSEFMALTQTWLGLLMNAAATGEGGDCYGDSGGPKFLDGDKTTIYATVTTGDMNCRATTWDWRLDTSEARSFLGQYVALP